MSSLNDDLDRGNAPGWTPQPGDKVVGRVVAMDTRVGKYSKYPIVTMKRESGEEVALHCFHFVLRRELAKFEPKVGDELGVLYEGPPIPPKTYHRYKVVGAGVGAQAAGVDWKGFAEEDEDETPPVNDLPPDTAGLEDEKGGGDDDIPF